MVMDRRLTTLQSGAYRAYIISRSATTTPTAVNAGSNRPRANRLQVLDALCPVNLGTLYCNQNDASTNEASQSLFHTIHNE